MTTHPGGDGEGLATALYGLDLLIASVLLNVMIGYIANNRDLVPNEIADQELRDIERQRRGIVAVLAVSTAIAILLPNVAVALHLLSTSSFVVVPLLLARRASEDTG